MKENQLSLFHAPAALPDGFSYQADVLSAEDELELVDQIKGLAFREFELRGFLGKRRIVSFGWQYDFDAQQLLFVGSKCRRWNFPRRFAFAI